MSRHPDVLMNITIDTEVDKSYDWTNPELESYTSVLNGIPDLLTPLFEKYGARPTYLLSSEVMEQPDCVKVLKEISNCELGTHLHGDVVEPHKTILDMRNKRIKEMQCSYSREIETEKLQNLTEIYRRAFRRAPKAFRAGRFGAGSNTISILERLGYTVDSSVTPYIFWNYAEGKADFRRACNHPYYPSEDDITTKGGSKILEVPVSIVPHYYYKLLDRMSRSISGSLCALNDMFYCIWISPVESDYFRLRYGINKSLRCDPDSHVLVLNMMFHSMDVIPGASPAIKADSKKNVVLKRLDSILELCERKNFKFATLSETVAHFPKDS
jgi:hypothetical protein